MVMGHSGLNCMGLQDLRQAMAVDFALLSSYNQTSTWARSRRGACIAGVMGEMAPPENCRYLVLSSFREIATAPAGP